MGVRAFVVGLVCGLLSLATAADDWASLTKRLHAPLASGEFSQVKHIGGLPLPLQSSGIFVVENGQLRWLTLLPFESELRISVTEVAQWEQDRKVWAADAQAQPMVATLAKLMLALVAGDASALAQLFQLTQFEVIDEKCWALTLRPLDSVLAAHLTEVQARGCEYLAQLSFGEAGGDTTLIQLSPQS